MIPIENLIRINQTLIWIFQASFDWNFFADSDWNFFLPGRLRDFTRKTPRRVLRYALTWTFFEIKETADSKKESLSIDGV